MAATERSKWDKLTEKERRAQFYTFGKPVPEKNITPEIRQAAFDNYSATDDHLMHITGTVTDQNGKRYFRTKNSWAADSNTDGGYLNMSEAYARLNTIAIMIHKDAVTKEIRKKLGIK
jgi:bleomycin hydrolase